MTPVDQSWQHIVRRKWDGYQKKKKKKKSEAQSNEIGMKYYRKAAGIGMRAWERREWLPRTVTARLLLPKFPFIYSQEVTEAQIFNTKLRFKL